MIKTRHVLYINSIVLPFFFFCAPNLSREHTVATKIIRQASINFFHSLYLRLEKSAFHQHVDRSVL